MQRPFQPVVHAVMRQLKEHLGDRLHSLYLYGSVARWEAVPGRSDLDLTVLTHEKIDRQRLDPLRERLAAQHSVVSKVDFDLSTVAEAVHPDHRFGERTRS